MANKMDADKNFDKNLDKNLDKLDQKNYLNSLFDFYQNLFTEKQKEYFIAYYFEDYSLREIAEDKNVSSNAVYDQIKTIEKTLEKYEDCLHLWSLNQKRDNLIEQINTINNQAELDSSKKKELIHQLLEELKNI